MDSEAVEAYAVLAAAVALLAFVVAEALAIFSAQIPKTTITVSTRLGPLQIGDMPDPYAVAASAVRALILLALGLTGAKLLEIGLTLRRRMRQEKALQQYYQQYYQYQQY
ncbi:MAG: hypothetical protein JZD41_03375 [Thermoproteus sp.]|nr:hypothetical protein [Thermoproteus sp.]